MTVPKDSIWAAEFLAAGISPDHCDDVLAGCYDVPLNFSTEKPPVILDVGANVGAFVRWAVRRWPGCVLHCYEPHPGNFALLQRTIATIGPEESEIHANNVAVFNEETPIKLHVAKTNCGAHSFFNLGQEDEQTIVVQAIHAQTLPRADILKLDIEGAEMSVLLALADVGRLREFSAVMLEYHSEMIRLAVKQLMSEQGFAVTGEKVHEKNRGELRFVKCVALAPVAADAPANAPRQTAKTKPKVFIATPAHDHKFHSGFVFSLLKLGKSGMFDLTMNRVAGCGVARARNNMAHEFLTTTDAQYYAAIDSDIAFEPEHLARAIAFDKPIVAVPYALKQTQLQWCLNEIPGEVPNPETGFQKVSTAGTGFFLVKREVFEKMIEAFPDIAYEDDLPEMRGQTRWDFFSMGVLKRRYLTEDWYFCVRARMLGYDIWMDATTHVAHEGLISFPLEKQKEGMFGGGA